MSRFLTAQQVADELGLAQQTVWNWGHNPDKPHWIKVGNRRRYPRTDFEAWLRGLDGRATPIRRRSA